MLANIKDSDPKVNALRERAVGILRTGTRKEAPRDRAQNVIGAMLLIASFLLFSWAIGLQLETDPAFREPPAAAH